MKILLTNDDGICGEGLRTLACALKRAGHDIVVVAPAENNSAVSHKLTMYAAIRCERADFDGVTAYALGGTPVDCVLVALCHLKIKPELILSGINAGLNLGIDIHYSGTVAGAMEGALDGVPSIALSQRIHRSDTREERTAAYERATEYTIQHLDDWYKLAHEAGVINVNFPDCKPKGIRFTRASHTTYNTAYSEGEEGLRMILTSPNTDGTGDIQAVYDGYVSIMPLRLDPTLDEILIKWEQKNA